MRTTIKDIANKTNLSITTVSLVLNNKESKISEKTKQLVLQTAKELNYRPNQLAIGLVKRHTQTIGLVLPDITNFFFAELAKAVEDETAKNDYNMILCNSGNQYERDLKNIDMLIDKGVDGIILAAANDCGEQEMEDACRTAERSGVSLVMIDRHFGIKGVGSVSLDNAAGGYLAVKHLIDNGHVNIGFITGPITVPFSRERMLGVRRAMAEAGLPVNEAWCFEGDFQFSGGLRAAEYFYASEVTAVFAFSDVMAISFIRRSQELDVRVPQDVSVIGFDDISLARLMGVTTVHQPIYEMGASAAQMIVKAVEGQGDTVHKIFIPSLTARATTMQQPQPERDIPDIAAIP